MLSRLPFFISRRELPALPPPKKNFFTRSYHDEALPADYII